MVQHFMKLKMVIIAINRMEKNRAVFFREKRKKRSYEGDGLNTSYFGLI